MSSAIGEKEVERHGDQVSDLTDKMNNINMRTNEESKDTNVTTLSEPERLRKHPLQNAWTLWFFKNDKSRSWEENQRPIITVTTVEDFWSLYNHIEVASKLPPGADYSMFKEGIFPDWEDPRNQDGGRWVIAMDKRKRELLDTYWLEIMFFLIGEHADQHAYQVSGAVVNIRMRTDKLAVWLGDGSQEEAVRSIGRMLRQRLELSSNTSLGFTIHSEEKTQTRPGPGKVKYTA